MDITALDASAILSLQARLLKVAAIYGEGWTPALAPIGDIAIKHTELRSLTSGAEVWHTTTVTWYLSGDIAHTLSVHARIGPRNGHPATQACGAAQMHVAPTDPIEVLHDTFAACLHEARFALHANASSAAVVGAQVSTVGALLEEDRIKEERIRNLRDDVVGIALNDAKVGEVLHVALNRKTTEVTDGK